MEEYIVETDSIKERCKEVAGYYYENDDTYSNWGYIVCSPKIKYSQFEEKGTYSCCNVIIDSIDELPKELQSLPVISYEEWKQIINKKEMEKEIIGYKLKPDCEKYRRIAQDIVYKHNGGYSIYLNEGTEYMSVTPICGRTTHNILEEAGVLDLWFTPVYKEDEYKVGDWVYVIDRSFTIKAPCTGVLKIQSLDNSRKTSYKNNFLFTNGGYAGCNDNVSNYIRKATNEEIKNYLIEEAKKRGFKEGVRVKDNGLNRLCPYNDITYFNDFGYDENSDQFWIRYTTKRSKYSMCIYKKGKWAEIISSYPDITINGYKGEFFGDHVKFGCATISKSLFIDLNKFDLLKHVHNAGNKEITSITIGKGTFKVEQIKEIAEYYLNQTK